MPPVTPPPRRAWLATATKLLALFLLILGAKFYVMRACSSPLPFFDQWDGEGGTLLQPFLHGRLRLADLFAFHVQHRIALTRLLVLGLFQANGGQWDAQVEMIAAAVLHALCAVVLGTVLIRRLGSAAEDKLLCVLALLFALPFGWENTLSGGFESCFYFMLLLSILTVWGLACHRPGSAAWWTGVGAAVLSWFSLASAPLTPLVVAAEMARRRWRPGADPARPPTPARLDWITLGTALALFVAGASTDIGINPVTPLQPRSALDFIGKFLGLLGWPNPTAWAAPLAYGPLAFLLGRRLFFRHRGPVDGSADSFLLPLGAFALLQTAAVAFARNQYRGLLVSRYMDVLSIGALVNFACLLVLARETRSPRERAWLGALGAGWIVALGVGLAGLTAHNLAVDLPFFKANNAHEDANVARLAAHPDQALLTGKNAFDFQCDKPRLLLDLMRDPLVRAAPPPRAREPLALLPVKATGTLHAILAEDATPATASAPAGWSLELPPPGTHLTIFRSQTIDRCLPHLEFSVSGAIGPLVRFGLVGERTGRTEWILPPENAAQGPWWPARVRAPAEPFHVEAAVCAGAGADGLKFLCPREIGWLSAWVDPLLDSAHGLLFAGAALWLAAAFAGGLSPDRAGRTRKRSSPEFSSPLRLSSPAPASLAPSR